MVMCFGFPLFGDVMSVRGHAMLSCGLVTSYLARPPKKGIFPAGAPLFACLPGLESLEASDSSVPVFRTDRHQFTVPLEMNLMGESAEVQFTEDSMLP